MAKSLAIELIRTDGGTQMRAELDRDVYLDYRDKFLAGVKFPPIDVFHDGSTYWLADGFHRFYGAREAKRGSIEATVHNGTVRDAILFAAGANQAHGHRRTNADKRNCVLALLNDEDWVKWSDRKIAEHAGVSVNFVGDMRQLSLKDSSSPAAKTKDEPRTGRDGKKRRRPKRKREPVAINKWEPKGWSIEDGKSVPFDGKNLIDGQHREEAVRKSVNGSPKKPDKPERAVFVKLRALFDEMTRVERHAAMTMWTDWMEE